MQGSLLSAAVVSLVLIPLAGGAGADRPRTLERPLAAGLAQREQAPRELIVRFREGVGAAEQTRTVRAEGGRIARSLRLERTKLVRLPAGESVEQAVAALEDDPDVAFAEPNTIRQALALPDDPSLAQLWALDQPSDADIDAPTAWNTTTGSASVVVAVIDTGIAYDHPDLAPNMWTNPADPTVDGIDDDGNGKTDDLYGWDFIQNDKTPLDFFGHGTHVAGTIGAQGNNALGVTGVNWDVSLMALRAGDAYGGFPLDETVDAIAYACAHGARVVNGSYGGSSSSLAEKAAIAAPACASTLFVFAAGNEGSNNQVKPSYPCSYPSTRIICVAASTKTDGLASYSNFGTKPVDLAAPGGGGGPGSGTILSTVPDWQPVGETEGFEDPDWPRWGNPLGAGQPWNRSNVANDGAFTLADSPGGNYSSNSNSSIGSLSPLDLSGRRGCLLIYDMRLDTELDDDLFVIRTGPTTAANAFTVVGWSGDSGGSFDRYVDDLSVLDGAPAAYLRFALESDADSSRGDGAYLDDVEVWCQTPAADEYEGSVGTSMASPQVAGAAALVLAAHPAWTTAHLRAALLNSVDKKTGLAGKVASGGRLNVAKAIAYTAPDTRLMSGPGGKTRRHKAIFKLVSTAVESHFQCRLDRNAWKACGSTRTYTRLRPGAHTFRARSIDAVGNVDPNPLVRSWRIT